MSWGKSESEIIAVIAKHFGVDTDRLTYHARLIDLCAECGDEHRFAMLPFALEEHFNIELQEGIEHIGGRFKRGWQEIADILFDAMKIIEKEEKHGEGNADANQYQHN